MSINFNKLFYDINSIVVLDTLVSFTTEVNCSFNSEGIRNLQER